MATKNSGFTAEEKAAMKERAAELKAEKKRQTKAEKVAAEAQAVLDKIAEMAEEDRVIAESLHALITKVAPDLRAKLWYGMPNWSNAAGKSIVFFQDAGKFKVRYATIGFNPDAALDDGPMWATSFAIVEWTHEVASRVAELVERATRNSQ